MSSFQWDWGFAWRIVPDLLSGIEITILATFLGSLLSFILGLLWTILRMRRDPYVAAGVELFVSFIRGTPLLVQLYFLFYVFPTWGLTMSTLTTGIVGLGVSYSAYASEIYRAGIDELAAGQWEAALTLGLPIKRVWLGIILPQAIKAVLPMLGNLVVSMFKETSLLSTITVMELLAQSKNIGSIDFRYVEPMTLAGLFYFVISYSAARALRRMEGKHAIVS